MSMFPIFYVSSQVVEEKITDNFKGWSVHETHFMEVDGTTLPQDLADYHHQNLRNKKRFPWGAEIYRKKRAILCKMPVNSSHSKTSTSDTVNPKLWAAANGLKKKGGRNIFAAALGNFKTTYAKEAQGIVKAMPAIVFDAQHKHNRTLGMSFVKYTRKHQAKANLPQEYFEAENIVVDVLMLTNPPFLIGFYFLHPKRDLYLYDSCS